MPIHVYPWPPVASLATEWTIEQPVNRVRSALTGRDVMQASRPPRRVATVVVSALAAGRQGAGYCEMLRQLLVGGIHGVRLRSSPINWWLDELPRRAPELNPEVLSWDMPPAPLAWQGITWVTGNAVIGGTPGTSGPWGSLPVSGLPPRREVGRTGDFIRLYSPTDPSVFETARLMRRATTNARGSVTLKLDRIPTISAARVMMAGQDEAVFRPDGPMPRSVQPLSGDWSYTWKLREVFSAEVGGFEERPNAWT